VLSLSLVEHFLASSGGLKLRVGQVDWFHAGTEKPDRFPAPPLYLSFSGQYANALLEEPFELAAFVPAFGLVQGTQMVKHRPERDRPPKPTEVIEYDIIQRIMAHPVVFLTLDGGHELAGFSFLGCLALDINCGWFNEYHATNYSLLVANRRLPGRLEQETLIITNRARSPPRKTILVLEVNASRVALMHGTLAALPHPL
jgi:hypothetical protein